MDNLKFINTKTWEIIDLPEELIYADKDIAETIAIFNKKGYKTRASCSGHPDIIYTQWADDIEKVDEYLYPIRIEYDKSIDKMFFYKMNEEIDIYVMFEDVYSFDNLPEGFNYEKRENYCIIRCTIKVHNENNEFYDYETLRDIIKNYNIELLEWAKKIKNNN